MAHQDSFHFFDWERAAVQKLYADYTWTLVERKLKLRPAAIALSDSETRWGEWDAQTRTIRLSRQLLLAHPWFQVQGILRHELAHQWVSEGGGLEDSRPHGERFKDACRRVGVPESFARASADLAANPLDWREERRDDPAERLLEKVRKLLALATSSNEHEAALAMHKVRELYARHHLDEAAAARPPRFAHAVITHGKRRIDAFQEKIIGILVGHFFVQVLVGPSYDAKSGETHRAVEIIGSRENVLMAEYVYHFLLTQSERLAREGSRGRPAFERRSYRLGVLDGFAEKLRRAEQPGPEAAPVADAEARSLIGRAVARFKGDPALDEYISGVYPRLRSRGRSASSVDGEAFFRGRDAGKSLTLNRAVVSRGGSSGRLLPGS